MNTMQGLELGIIHFQRPLWLLGLLALPLLAWAWRARARRRSVWREVIDPHLLPHLLEGESRLPGVKSSRFKLSRFKLSRSGIAQRLRRIPHATSGVLALFALALTCIALAGPGWRKVDQPLWQPRAPLVVALDLSSVALTGDLPPSRLAQARTKLTRLLQERQGGQVALVVYAEDAYTVAPLTNDVANIGLFLDALEPDVMPEDGRRVDRAITWSLRLLRQGGFERGDILLLAGDVGADAADARAAAADAARAGYRVSVLGLGSMKGAAYRTPDGVISQARLDEPALRALARAGDGGYARLRPDSGDLDALALLDPANAATRTPSRTQTTTWADQGYWLLPPLLLLAALAFRRGVALVVLLASLWLPVAPVRAQDGTLWQRPDQRAYAQMQRGSRAYRAADYAAAADAFKTVQSVEGAYNLGNALAKQGRYQAAIAAYDRALAQQPKMEDAIANRQAVLDAMRKTPAPGGNRNPPRPQTGQGNPQSRPDHHGDPGQGQPDQRLARKPSQQDQSDRRDQRDNQEQPQQPSRAEQSAADAAQRQRMGQALAQQQQQQRGGERHAQDSAKRAEDTTRQERSLATEALLKRVPDDPGALLRAKFQLEYERRREQGSD